VKRLPERIGTWEGWTLEGAQTNTQAIALEIESFRYSDSAWTQKLSQWSDSLPMEFPDAGSAFDDYRDQTADGLSESDSVGSGGSTPGDSRSSGDAASASVSDGEFKQLSEEALAAEIESAEERGCIQGIQIGISQGREGASGELKKERERLTAQAGALLASFSEARESCLHQLEQEAVRLALAIAARILRREAQTDPLLLMGAVRVALGQLSNSTAVRLRVPGEDQAMWEESLMLMPGLAIRPKVIGDATMELGECRMETEIGSADLGLWAQLKTIEKGFFYRLGDPFGAGGSDAEASAAESLADRTFEPRESGN
jgi:flagellar assembly protein FliH